MIPTVKNMRRYKPPFRTVNEWLHLPERETNYLRDGYDSWHMDELGFTHLDDAVEWFASQQAEILTSARSFYLCIYLPGSTQPIPATGLAFTSLPDIPAEFYMVEEEAPRTGAQVIPRPQRYQHLPLTFEYQQCQDSIGLGLYVRNLIVRVVGSKQAPVSPEDPPSSHNPLVGRVRHALDRGEDDILDDPEDYGIVSPMQLVAYAREAQPELLTLLPDGFSVETIHRRDIAKPWQPWHLTGFNFSIRATGSRTREYVRRGLTLIRIDTQRFQSS